MTMRRTFLLMGIILSTPAFAACPFGIDCKPPPCETTQQDAATAPATGGYAPRFQAAYGSPARSPNPYLPGTQSNQFRAGNTYQLPPCDPNAAPAENKPVAPPAEEEPENGNEGYRAVENGG